MRCNFEEITDLKKLLIYSLLFTEAEYSHALNLFHYTSSLNVGYIIKDKYIDLRLTRADCFADCNEGKHIIDIFHHAIDTSLETANIDRAFADVLRAVTPDFVPISEKLRSCYVACFSKNSDNKYLVRNYACKNGNDGVVIGFQTLDVEGLTEITCQGQHPITILDVLYDIEELSTYMQSLFCQMYRLKEQDDETYSMCKRIAVNQLAIYSLVYKSSDYQKEEETRLIIDFSKVEPQNNEVIADKDEKYIHVLLDRSALYNCREVTP